MSAQNSVVGLKPNILEELKEVPLCLDHPECVVKIGTRLHSQINLELIKFLKQHQHTFTWSIDDMVSISLEVIGLEFKQTILLEILAHPSILDVENVCSMDKTNETWMDQILSCIHNGTLLSGKLDAQRVQVVALKYMVLSGQLYGCLY